MLEYGNRGTLGSFHRVVVDGLEADRTGAIMPVSITHMDERGILHAVSAEEPEVRE